jgi:hypothetical protein
MTGLTVIGAGFGRTGTLSLRQALDDLGVGPTYHGEDIVKSLRNISLWRRVAQGRPVAWESIFEGFGAAVDYPICSVWPQLADHYPDAKIVLTTRDPEAWWRSTRDTIYAARTTLPKYLRRMYLPARWYVEVTDHFIWDGSFDGRFDDREYAIKKFEQHIADVKMTADPERLLVFDVAEGWEPLCEFLGVPVPDHPFPRLNDTARMNRELRKYRIGTRVVPPLFWSAVAGAAWWAHRRRSTTAV